MGRKGLHCTDSTNFYTESTFKTYFTFCAEARNQQLFGFDSRTLRNMLILQARLPNPILLTLGINLECRPKHEESKAA